MKTNLMNKSHATATNSGDSPAPAFSSLALCRKIVDRIERAKAEVISQFRDELGIQERLLHLAVNEAEALAWETGLPHLFFPTLALQKVDALASWSTRQRSLQSTNYWRAFAA